MRFTKMAVLAAVLLGVGLGSQVRANSVDPITQLTESGPVAGVFSYTVAYDITSTSTVVNGDIITLFNLPAFTAPSSSLIGGSAWVLSSTASSFTFTYTPTPSTTTIGPTSFLGTLSFKSTTDISKITPFNADGVGDLGQVGSEATYNDSISGPSHNFNSLSSVVPLPNTAWMGMSMLLGLGALGAFRKRYQQA